VIIEPAQPAEVADLVVRAYGLTPRKRELLGLVLRGSSTKEIAAALWLTPRTVPAHLTSIFEKTGVSSRRELAGRLFLGLRSPRGEARLSDRAAVA
jgi:DNA-binding CsgD family transcriptional regulator